MVPSYRSVGLEPLLLAACYECCQMQQPGSWKADSTHAVQLQVGHSADSVLHLSAEVSQDPHNRRWHGKLTASFRDMGSGWHVTTMASSLSVCTSLHKVVGVTVNSIA